MIDTSASSHTLRDQGRGISGHGSARPQSRVWLTPPGLITALGHFDLDPCAAPEPRQWSTAAAHIAPPDDGLASAWHGRVWLNPPYDRTLPHWLAKLADHPGGGIALTFARTDTSWFHDYVLTRATAILFLRGRLHFHHPDGTRAPHNAGGPSCLITYTRHDATHLAGSGLPGHYTPLRPRPAAGEG
ncbi:DNA N-6-adenine-methyltransferase [Nocardia asiatica]|uniref:DNA N-6-adenine-methyltransferase n=1 Tax=Nocardia asiatica TaxID=209252 RepID=UPI0006889EA2|nr:DNA N-6-adenine-methyltransferase [Nocardia asiatica]